MTDLKSVAARLAAARSGLAVVEEQYEAALHSQSVGEQLQLAVDNVVYQQRSALDFLANRVVEQVTGAPAKQVAYPMESSAAGFRGKIERLLPGVAQARPDVLAVIEQRQRWQPGYEWLGELNDLVNRGKHVDLVPQTRQETPRVEVKGQGGSVSWGPGVTFGSGVSIMGSPVNPRTQMPLPAPGLQITKTLYVDWLLPNGQSALGSLRRFQQGLETLVPAVASVAGLVWPV